MKPITTTDLNEAIEWCRIHLELRKTKSDKPLTMSDLDKIERHLLSLIQLKRILKMVKYYGGFEAIQETLSIAIQAKQPSLFPVESEQSTISESRNEIDFSKQTTP